MNWIGKFGGTALGWVVGRPLGALLGALLGHQLDRGWRGADTGGVAPEHLARREPFLRAAFSVMGHVAKADGRVSEKAIAAARWVIQRMQLKSPQVAIAIECFNTGKAHDYPLQRMLDQLYAKMGSRDDLCRLFVALQMEVAVASGEITPRKRAVLWQVASTLGVNRLQLAQLEAMARAQFEHAHAAQRRDAATELARAYRVLELPQKATDPEVKAAYRRLMNLFHPDKLAARGLPESEQEKAKQKTHEIRGAYDLIRKVRGLR